MRLLFIGGTKRGFLTLQALLDHGVDVVGVISLRQDSHEHERYEERVRELGGRFGVPVFETRSMKEQDWSAVLRQQVKPEIALVVGCRILLARSIYDLPALGTLAVHDSLLPRYRGFAPLNWALINGEERTGVTLFYLAEKVDAGDIVGQTVVPIGPQDNAATLQDRICEATIAIVLRNLGALESGQAPRTPQNESDATFGCARTPADGAIDWARPVREIHNLVRALTYPYPGAFSFLGGRRLTIWDAVPVEPAPNYEGRIPGRVVGRDELSGTVDVLTADGVLRLNDVQFEGGLRVRAAEAIRSVRVSLGPSPVDLLERLNLLETHIATLASVCEAATKETK